jgi:hypothetical protein
MRRFDLEANVDWDGGGNAYEIITIEEVPKGDYVLYEEAKAEIDKLQKQLDLLGGDE